MRKFRNISPWLLLIPALIAVLFPYIKKDLYFLSIIAKEKIVN
jgi:hypothetical protein